MEKITYITTKAAVAYFGSIVALGTALEIWPHNVYRWGKYPPKKRQLQVKAIIEMDTLND